MSEAAPGVPRDTDADRFAATRAALLEGRRFTSNLRAAVFPAIAALLCGWGVWIALVQWHQRFALLLGLLGAGATVRFVQVTFTHLQLDLEGATFWSPLRVRTLLWADCGGIDELPVRTPGPMAGTARFIAGALTLVVVGEVVTRSGQRLLTDAVLIAGFVLGQIAAVHALLGSSWSLARRLGADVRLVLRGRGGQPGVAVPPGLVAAVERDADWPTIAAVVGVPYSAHPVADRSDRSDLWRCATGDRARVRMDTAIGDWRRRSDVGPRAPRSRHRRPVATASAAPVEERLRAAGRPCFAPALALLFAASSAALWISEPWLGRAWGIASVVAPLVIAARLLQVALETVTLDARGVHRRGLLCATSLRWDQVEAVHVTRGRRGVLLRRCAGLTVVICVLILGAAVGVAQSLALPVFFVSSIALALYAALEMVRETWPRAAARVAPPSSVVLEARRLSAASGLVIPEQFSDAFRARLLDFAADLGIDVVDHSGDDAESADRVWAAARQIPASDRLAAEIDRWRHEGRGAESEPPPRGAWHDDRSAS